MMNSSTKPQATRFTFDRDFDRESGGATKANGAKRAVTPDELSALEKLAYIAGEQSAATAAARRTAEELALLSQKLAGLQTQMDETLRAARAEAIKLAYVIASKFAQTMIAARPAAEIEALIARCLDEQRSEPNLVIRVSDALHDLVRSEVARLTSAKNFAGRVVVIGEPQIPGSDCSIEWAEGGVERNLGSLEASIAEVMRIYLQAQGIGEPAPAAQPSKEGVSL